MAFKVIKESILRENTAVAQAIRADLSARKVLMVNIIAGPGAGKTTLLEKTAPFLRHAGIEYGVITGDCFMTHDAQRLDALGVPVVQINTGNCCHIDAQLVRSAAAELSRSASLVIVENVGNLVCPAEFDIGEDAKVALLSVAEGHEKPLKYPLLFSESAVVVITKTDLLAYTDFSMETCVANIRAVNPQARIISVSCKNGEGVGLFADWLREKLTTKQKG